MAAFLFTSLCAATATASGGGGLLSLGGALVRVGSAPVLPAGTRPLAAVSSDRVMRITVVLRPRDPAALAAYAGRVGEPGSADYRRYLTPRSFARRFGASAATVAAVERSLRAHGLTPRSLSANRLSISLQSAAGVVEHAFSTELAAVRLPSGAGAVVNTLPPALDPAVAASVQAVIGLSSLDAPRPAAARDTLLGAVGSPVGRRAGHLATGGPQPCAAASSSAGPQHAYTADQIASAYGFPGLYRGGDEGQGVTVALYELEPFAAADVATYQSCYGTHAAVSSVPVDGGAGSGAGSGEAAFDIEQVIGLAPRARVLVYEAPNSDSGAPGAGPYDLYSAIVSQDRAQVVSTSWGQCEPLEGSTDAVAENTLFEEAATQGQTMLSASGDEGSQDCNAPPPSIPDTRLAVDDPAGQPFVTGVGGTSLASAGQTASETVWNNGGSLIGLLGIVPGASGGGISSLWAMPGYQSLAARRLHVAQALSSGAPCHSSGALCREVPDVAADADPRTGYLIYYNGSGSALGQPSGWQGTGGTSGAAPLWAALTALADADRACQAVPVGFLNPVLYRLAGARPGAYLNDVVSGNNDFTGTTGGRYPAAVGYDMATGLGSPRATALAGALCADSLKLALPARIYTFRGIPARVRVRVSDGPGFDPRVGVHRLPDGLSFDRYTELITGRPLRLGVSRAVLVAFDAVGSWRITRSIWTVDEPPGFGGTRLSGLASGRPALAVSLRSGRYEPGLRTVSLSLPAGLSLSGVGRRAVRVRGTAGHPVRFSLSSAGTHVTVRLRAPSGTLRISFGRGSLAAPRSARAAGRSARVLELTARTLDAGGQHATRTVALRPSS